MTPVFMKPRCGYLTESTLESISNCRDERKMHPQHLQSKLEICNLSGWKKKKFATIAGISFQPSFLVAQEALVPPALSRPVKSFMCIELDFAAGFWPGQKRANWF